jgi:hypothetical protein
VVVLRGANTPPLFCHNSTTSRSFSVLSLSFQDFSQIILWILGGLFFQILKV